MEVGRDREVKAEKEMEIEEKAEEQVRGRRLWDIDGASP